MAIDKEAFMSVASGISINGYNYDLDEEEQDFKLCSMEEFAQRLRSRDDIFAVDRNTLLRNTQVVCLFLAVATGIWISQTEYLTMGRNLDPFLPLQKGKKPSGGVKMIREPIVLRPKPKVIKNPKVIKIKNIKRRLASSGKKPSGGDPLSRIKSKGILGIMSGLAMGKELSSSDPLARGGYEDKIDAVLAGVGGLKIGTNSGTGRRGVTAIGSGSGSDGGFGDGSGGIGDIYDGLIEPDYDTEIGLKKVPPKEISIALTTPANERTIVGGRSRASIMRVVTQNLMSLRYAYNKRLREIPGLKGKVKIKFAIDEFGKVLFCEVLDSSIEDPVLQKQLLAKIKRWVFDKVDKPGDVTEVVYPFVFSM